MSEKQRTIRERVDPEGILPAVELVVDPTKKVASGSLVPTQYLIMADGQQIGRTTLTESTSREKPAFLNGIIIDEELRGKGYGLATYLAAIEVAHKKGETFRTHDWTQTEEATRVWGKFIKAGVAEVVEPFTLSHVEPDGTNKYTGHVQIPPPELHA